MFSPESDKAAQMKGLVFTYHSYLLSFFPTIKLFSMLKMVPRWIENMIITRKKKSQYERKTNLSSNIISTLILSLSFIPNSHTAAGEHLHCSLAPFPCISNDHVENTWELIM